MDVMTALIDRIARALYGRDFIALPYDEAGKHLRAIYEERAWRAARATGLMK